MKVKYRKKSLAEFQRLPRFPRKKGFVFFRQFRHLKALQLYSVTDNIRFRLFTDFKTNLEKTQILIENFWRVSTFGLLCQKNGFVFVNKIWHFKALNQ